MQSSIPLHALSGPSCFVLAVSVVLSVLESPEDFKETLNAVSEKNDQVYVVTKPENGYKFCYKVITKIDKIFNNSYSITTEITQ